MTTRTHDPRDLARVTPASEYPPILRGTAWLRLQRALVMTVPPAVTSGLLFVLLARFFHVHLAVAGFVAGLLFGLGVLLLAASMASSMYSERERRER